MYILKAWLFCISMCMPLLPDFGLFQQPTVPGFIFSCMVKLPADTESRKILHY